MDFTEKSSEKLDQPLNTFGTLINESEEYN